jgi:hypothetical protein
MTQDDRAKMKLQEEYRAYLMATLPPIEEYASSSNEEEANPISSISKSVEESPPSKIRKRLPGIIEKWNSDVESDNEDEEKADNTKAGDDVALHRTDMFVHRTFGLFFVQRRLIHSYRLATLFV